jgi:hypothetical protein
MYLSYSGYACHESCPFGYWRQYDDHTPTEKEDNRVGSLYGTSVGVLFEQFYEERIWKSKGAQEELLSRAEKTVDQVIKDQLTPSKYRPAGVLKWKGDGPDQDPTAMYESREELLADVRDAVVRGLKIIRFYRLLGAYARAEVRLDQIIRGHKIGGRADFILYRTKPHLDWVILDGKGSKHRSRYSDPRQLMWYGALYLLKYGEIPDRLGFLYWRYDPPETIDWMEFSEESLLEFSGEVMKTVRKIDLAKRRMPKDNPVMALEMAKKLFPAKPSRSACRFCPYATEKHCPRGAKVVQEINRGRKR